MGEWTHYLDLGSGETVILLPSNWLTSYAYKSIAEKLATRYRVIVPDFFRGKSKFSKNASCLEDYVKKLRDLVLELKLSKYSLVGISFSGLIASEYLHMYPKELKKVMLISTIPPLKVHRENGLTLVAGILGYSKLFFTNSFSFRGIKTNLLWIYDGLVYYLFRHPKQFLLDPIIVTKKLKVLKEQIPVPTKILMARQDEFLNNENLENTKSRNLVVEKINGNHTWFFLNESLFAKKVFDFLN